jgi:membrane fusion protein (multidrug efflux system)
MPMMQTVTRLACFVVVLISLVGPARAQGDQPSAVAVGTVYAERKPIAKTADFVGRIEAIIRVEIRARVKGYLEAVLFKEGELVQDGQPLYRIEKGLFEAEVEQAAGALERAKAAFTLAELQRKRAEELLAKAAGTAVARDQAVAEEEKAKGTIMIDEANLRTAKINLGYTDISAPITGKIGRTNLTKGNVVGPESGPLTTIVSQDPMYVTFPVSQREFLKAQEDRGERDPKSIKVRIRFSDGSVYDQLGRTSFLEIRQRVGFAGVMGLFPVKM